MSKRHGSGRIEAEDRGEEPGFRRKNPALAPDTLAGNRRYLGAVYIPTICIDCRYVSGRPSGIAEVTRALAERVPALAPDLDFLLLRNPERRLPLATGPNVTETIVAAAANGPLTMWFLPEIAPLDKVDLFHSPFNIMPARLPCPAVTTVHDIMWRTRPDLCPSGRLGTIRGRFFAHGIARALARSDRIAVVSEATAAAIVAHAPGAAARVRVTRSGVAERFRRSPPDERLLARLGIAPEARYALVVGQSAPYKNHEAALRAFARAFPAPSRAVIVFVQRQGGGGGKAPGRLARDLGVEHRVRFTGPVEETALIALYSGAALLFHPSLCEGFGNPLAEAMACGCPVVTSDRGAMAEVTGGAARLVDPDDIEAMALALREVWHDEGNAAAMREAGLARAAALDWDAFAKANVAIYRELLS